MPVYTVNSGGLLLTMPSTIPLRAGSSEVTVTSIVGLTDRQVEIFQLLKKSSGLSTSEIHSQLLSPPTERWLRDELNVLKNKGYIDSKGHTTAKKWFVKA
jgi:hypothetical protein